MKGINVFRQQIRKIALAAVVMLLIPVLLPVAKVQAAEEGQRIEEEIIYYGTVEMGENSYMEITETSASTTSVYYVDGAVVQRAILNKATGEIVCYDYSQKTEHADGGTGIQENVIKYHIDDFRVMKKTTHTTKALVLKHPCVVFHGENEGRFLNAGIKNRDMWKCHSILG